MIPLTSKLKNLNPSLIWYSDKDIDGFMSFLEKEGFVWEEGRKTFYCERYDCTIRPKDVNKFINDHAGLQRRIQEKAVKKTTKKKEISHNIRVAGYLINLLTFLVIMNLFLGWIILNIYFWIFLEIFLVFFLISFVKIRKKLRGDKNKYND